MPHRSILSTIPLRLSLPRRHRIIPWHLRPPPPPHHMHNFHTTTRTPAAASTHYETLKLPTSASPADIKRQFYALSKLHHPDHNKSDPTASQRFVLISEAYHVLGSPDRRARYDREHIHTAAHQHRHPSGSHSSHAGSRPASGLSKRRTTFRGPPPSFFRNGGWGEHSEKRSAHAAGGGGGFDSAAGGSGGASYAGTGANASGGGFGPGQAESGLDNDFTYWNRQRHHRTQEGVARRILESRKARGLGMGDAEFDPNGGRWSTLVNFVAVAFAIGLVSSIASSFSGKTHRGKID